MKQVAEGRQHVVDQSVILIEQPQPDGRHRHPADQRRDVVNRAENTDPFHPCVHQQCDGQGGDLTSAEPPAAHSTPSPATTDRSRRHSCRI